MDALEALHRRGGHFILCTPDKRPIEKNWQKNATSIQRIGTHIASGGLIGLIPASLGCFVVDVDEGGVSGVEVAKTILGEPLSVIETRRPGGFHLWYRTSTESINNRKWGLNGHGGDIRGSNGYVILWNSEQLADALVDQFENAVQAHPKMLPTPLHKKLNGPDTVLAAMPGERNETLNREVFIAAKEGTLDTETFRTAAITTGLSQTEMEATINSAQQAGAVAAKTVPHKQSVLTPSEIEVAHALAKQFKDTFEYRAARGWYRRESPSGLWIRDEESLVLRKTVSLEIGSRKLKRASSVKGVVQLLEPLLYTDKQWDLDPEVAGLPSGKVLDLRTGYVRAACQDERISLRLGANPDFAEPKLWIRTLNETLPPDCIEWFQRWCGYCLTGYTREHQFVFAFGAGRNGKSTVLGTIEKLLGGYCRGLLATALAGGRHEQHPECLARIEGARLVSALELSENASWRLALLKALVAGDMMTAHHMRKGSFDFQPVCKLVVAGNHKPNLSSVDKAIESRLVLLPFERTFEGNRVNQKLPEMLRAELPRILGWAVEGAMKFFRDGLGSKPVTANTASVEYLAEQNIFSEWVAERLEFILRGVCIQQAVAQGL